VPTNTTKTAAYAAVVASNVSIFAEDCQATTRENKTTATLAVTRVFSWEGWMAMMSIGMYDHGCAAEHSSNQARFQSVFSLESIQPLASLEVSFSDSSSFLGRFSGRFSIGQGALDYYKGFVPVVFQTSTGVSL